LPGCQWCVLLLTPEALRSPWIKLTAERALELKAQGALQEVFALQAAPFKPEEVPADWPPLTLIDATRDYKKTLHTLLSTLGAREREGLLPANVWQAHVIGDNGPVIAGVREKPPTLHSGTGLASEEMRKANGLPRTKSGRTPGRGGPSWRWLLLALALIVLLGGGTLALLNHIAPRLGGAAISLPAQGSGPQSSQGVQPPVTSRALTVPPQDPQTLYALTIRGVPLLNDTLVAQNGNNWDVTTNANGGCAFTDGAYRARALQPNTHTACAAHTPRFQNFAYQAGLRFMKGDGGGIVFRAQRSGAQITTFYRFSLYVQGFYRLFACRNCSGFQNTGTLLTSGRTAINANQLNTLAVIARGATVYLYVNGRYVGGVNASLTAAGEIGVYAVSLGKPTEVRFRGAEVWPLP
jgi:hypothetical protein